MFNNKCQIIVALISFLIIPLTFFISPIIKNVTIASIELIAESWILIQIVSIIFMRRNNRFSITNGVLLLVAILFITFADTLNSAYMLKFINDYELVSDCSYSIFAIFLLILLFNKINFKKIKLNEWLWFFLVIFITDGFASYKFLLMPYYQTVTALDWRVNSALYMLVTIIIFSILLPISFRVSDRKTFWFFNLIILLLTSDFAIRYQDTFIHQPNFSWAEVGWCYAFLGLAWLIHFSQNMKYSFIFEPIVLAPLISIRSLLTISICGANMLLLIGILSVKLYSFQTAIDITSVLLLLFLFWTIANEFSIWLANDLTKTLRYMFKSKEHLAADGLIQFNLECVTTKNHIFEIAKILESYNDLAVQTNNIILVVNETNKKATLAEIAFQVSHDIRSPLAALDMAVKSLPDLPEDSRILIRSSIGRIKDITNHLLQKNPKITRSNFQASTTSTKHAKSLQLLSSYIDRIISEKRMQFRAKIGIEIDTTLDENSYGIFSEIDTAEFMRIISNLINNAVESIKDTGRVTISLYQSNNYAIIDILDNGIGIPAEILKNLGQRGKTYGKKNGTGLGLYYAQKIINSWNGHLQIHSTPGLGTTIKIMLPLSKAAPWFVEHLHILPNSIIIILDDDLSIHQIWNGRFDKINANKHGVEIHHFSTPSQLITWKNSNEHLLSRALFLIDYEFLGFNIVGLDIVEDLNIQNQSILITSHYEETEVRMRCQKLNLQIIPKDMAAFIPITINSNESFDAALIDDDLLVHQSWGLSAQLKKIKLASFFNLDQFMRISHSFNFDLPIYIDVNLSNGVRGDDVALRIFEKGFKNIYLTTGYTNNNFLNLSHIKKLIGKNPPF